MATRSATMIKHRDGDAGRDHGRDGIRGDDHGHSSDRSDDHQHAGDTVGNSPATDDAIGPDSPGEIARKLARLEELERETPGGRLRSPGSRARSRTQSQTRARNSYRAQKEALLQALRTLQKSETPALMKKERDPQAERHH